MIFYSHTLFSKIILLSSINCSAQDGERWFFISYLDGDYISKASSASDAGLGPRHLGSALAEADTRYLLQLSPG
jgi:hypothetical protein